MQILYIEDHPNNVLLIQRIVRAEGHTFLHAVDGESGQLALLDSKPDLVFVDLRLPGKTSGYDLIRFIKTTPQLQLIPVVVLTANGYVDAARLAQMAGCDAILTKPADIRQIRSIIRQYLGEPQQDILPQTGRRSWVRLSTSKQ
jgi:two-component system cell cycle response regulator DivK